MPSVKPFQPQQATRRGTGNLRLGFLSAGARWCKGSFGMSWLLKPRPESCRNDHHDFEAFRRIKGGIKYRIIVV